jgi:hypothetical protein
MSAAIEYAAAKNELGMSRAEASPAATLLSLRVHGAGQPHDRNKPHDIGWERLGLQVRHVHGPPTAEPSTKSRARMPFDI